MKLSATITFLGLYLCAPFLKAQPLNDRPRNSPYEQNIEAERKIIPYEYLRQADVFWETRIWRVIDCREKINLPFVYPKEPLITIFLEAIKEQGLPAYSPLDDEFTQRITYAEIMSTLNTADTFYAPSAITGRDSMFITKSEFNPLTVNKYKIQEVWVIDKETSTMYPRIMGIAPVRDVYDAQTGIFRGESDMFWIYYPDAREILANHNAFNPNNDAIQMSWESIFEMRFFNSYIVKQSNVYDRPIQIYATGIDAVLEAKRIEEAIFDREHELWSF